MKKFSNKSIWDMSEKEIKYAGLAGELDLQYVKSVIKNNRAVKFSREGNNKYIIVSESLDEDNEYRVTVFDEYGPSGHYDRPNLHMTAKEVFSWIPHKQENIIPEEVI